MNTKELIIYGLNEHIAYCEAMGLSKCFEAYGENFADEYIEAIGFNSKSGYTYIVLFDGITICSMLGRAVEYLITDFESGEEFFFDTIIEAEKYLETLNA